MQKDPGPTVCGSGSTLGRFPPVGAGNARPYKKEGGSYNIMSTNKTQNYQFHAWELGDDFLLSEINENFAALDGAIPEIVTGTYLGEKQREYDDIHTIDLGFRPRAVFVIPRDGSVDSGGGNKLLGLFFNGFPMASNGAPEVWTAQVTDTGFEVRNKNSILLNREGYTFHYWAVR